MNAITQVSQGILSTIVGPSRNGRMERNYSKDICLQTLSLLFKCRKRLTKELFVSPANSSLVGILITIGDVTDIFAIIDCCKHRETIQAVCLFMFEI